MSKTIKLLRGTNEKLSDSNVRLNFGDGQIVYDTTNEEPNFFMNQNGILTRFKIEDDDSILPGQGSDVPLGGGSGGSGQSDTGPINVLFWGIGSLVNLPELASSMQNFNDLVANDSDQIANQSGGEPYSSDSTFQHMYSGTSDMTSATLDAFRGSGYEDNYALPYVGDSGRTNFGDGGPWDVMVVGMNYGTEGTYNQLAWQHIVDNRIPIILMMYGHTNWGLGWNVNIPNPGAGTEQVVDYKISHGGTYESMYYYHGQWSLNEEDRLAGLESFTRGILPNSPEYRGLYAINTNMSIVPPSLGVDKYGKFDHHSSNISSNITMASWNVLNWVKYNDFLQPGGNDRLMRRVDLNYYHGAPVLNDQMGETQGHYAPKRLLLNSIYWCANRLPDPDNAVIVP